MNFQPVNFVYSVNICNGVGVAAVGKPAGLEPHCTSSHGAATYSQENSATFTHAVFGEVDNFIKSKPCLICVMWEICRSTSAY